MSKERIKTFIEGFDDKMKGGIPRGHNILILGEPGTMKSSIAFYMLYKNAIETGLKGAYITLEQSRESFLDHIVSMGLDFDNVKDRISVVDLSLIRKNLDKLGQQTWTQIFKMYAQNLKKNMNYDILVLDSLPVLELLANFTEPRNDLFHLFEWLKELNTTIVLISEMSQSAKDFGQFGEDFLADGIIHLKMENVDGVTIQRRIRCVKMRGTHHSTDYHTLLYSDGEFQATRVITEKSDY
ncbi:MAG: circadian clock protein KaiC [Thermoplasmata archaeon]|nr:MAG: circadian clock protein KaiC [Thermoplasmata archaeon]